MLDMAVGGLRRDPESGCDLFRLQPASEQSDDLGLALGQTGRALDSRNRLPGRLEHRGDRVRVEAPGATLLSQSLGGLLR
jgi:hypothetical protein